ncbi:MAG: FG-GAP repeat protein [Planctomycetota bacterium]
MRHEQRFGRWGCSGARRAGWAGGALALLVGASAGQGGGYDLAGSYEEFATAVAVGDFDGDGFADLAVGVPGQDAAGVWDAGAVHVFYGRPGGFHHADSELWDQGSVGAGESPEVADLFGYALATGDFDGDGFDDLAIGVPYEDVGSTIVSGVVHVLRGSQAGLTAAGSQLWHQDVPGVAGAVENGDRFGDVLVAGDFDANGCDDLVIGVPNEAVGSVLRAGVVQVLYGIHGAGLTTTGSQMWYQGYAGLADQPEYFDQFGTGLCVGDFDADGHDDLAVGAPYESGLFLSGGGQVHVLFGKPWGLSAAGEQLLNEELIKNPLPEGDSLEFGWALAAGDFDGDGRDDLAVGAPTGLTVGGHLEGAVYVFYSEPSGDLDTGTVDFWTQGSPGVGGGPEISDRFGATLVAADFDIDGAADLAVGVPQEDIGAEFYAGAVNVLYGQVGGGLTAGHGTVLYQGAPGLPGGPDAFEYYGLSLAAGDFNSDGLADLAIGVPEDSPKGIENAGSVHVLHGDPAEGLSRDDDVSLHQFVWLFWF